MARNHCTSENSNHTETQKQSTTPKTITYERKCKECGRIFYSTAKNTQYCKSDSWKEKNMDEYLEWERQMLIDYVEQSKKCKMCGPRAPSRKVFEKYKR